MKPSWDDAPEWAKWLAQDRNGGWFWFEREPTWNGNEWLPNFGRNVEANCIESLGYPEPRP